MPPLAVHVKHAGKILDVSLNPDQPPSAFKDAVFQVTGVPPDRMKIMIKGGVLKVCSIAVAFGVLLTDFGAQDDTDWKKVGPKEVS